MDQSFLLNLGLTQEAISLYESLLQHGPQSAATLAKTTTVKRTYIYKIMNDLCDLGLATEIQTGRATHFKPLSPLQLQKMAENNIALAQKTQLQLQQELPDLLQLFTKHTQTMTTQIIATEQEAINAISKLLELGHPVRLVLPATDLPLNVTQFFHTTFIRLMTVFATPFDLWIPATHRDMLIESSARKISIITDHPNAIQTILVLAKDHFIAIEPAAPFSGLLIVSAPLTQSLAALFQHYE